MNAITKVCGLASVFLFTYGLLGYTHKEEYTVSRVVDGDTIYVVDRQDTVKVRLACIDAPELKQPGGQESKISLSNLIGNNKVRLQGREVDRYGRRIAEVYIRDTNVNLTMVLYGQAHIYPQYMSPCKSNRADYESAQQSAIQSRSGLWRYPSVIYPWIWRQRR